MLVLDDVIREALEKNPEAQSAQHTINALQRRVPQVKALPDPMVSVGWAGNLAPFSVMQGDNSSYRGVNVSEQFPYPGKLKLRGEIASKEAEAAQANYEAIRRRVTAEVRAAFFDYFYFDRAIQTTERNKELLEKLSKIAEARYRVGKAMQADVLRSQVEISLLIEKLTVLEQQRDCNYRHSADRCRRRCLCMVQVHCSPSACRMRLLPASLACKREGDCGDLWKEGRSLLPPLCHYRSESGAQAGAPDHCSRLQHGEGNVS